MRPFPQRGAWPFLLVRCFSPYYKRTVFGLDKAEETDMKRKTARDIFVESFHALAQTRSIDRITVREIAENCGYSTATFDRHFMDKYDLIVWDCARGIEQLMSRIGVNGGFNFDSKNRRPSNTYEDMFYGYILGMDTFALGLIKAAKLIEDGRLSDQSRQTHRGRQA